MILLIGLAIIGAGGYLIRMASRLQRDESSFTSGADTAYGTIIELRPVGAANARLGMLHGVKWHPVVRFATWNGREVDAVSPVGSNPPPSRVGQQVRVRYDPDDPNSILLPDLTANVSLVRTVLRILGGLMIAAGALVTVAGGLLLALT